MKFTLKSEIIPIVIVLITIALGFYFYSVFPAQVPLHWNINGQVDNWGSKMAGAIMGPAIVLGMYLLFLIIPLLDPKKEKYQEFSKVYFIFRLILMLVMLAVYLISALNTLGYPIRVEIWIPLIIGLLFMIMGNYMAKIKPNWFMGIRTPWTLSNDEVWIKTHRLGGKLFILMGLLMILNPLFNINSNFRFSAVMVAIGLMVIVPIVYSYILFRKLKH